MSIDLLPVNMRAKIAYTVSPVPEISGPCWTWQNCLNSKGYGNVSINGKVQLTHRAAYLRIVGDIPRGLQLDHLCRNIRCCNPEHLEPVTGKVNAERTAAATKTRCINGHELAGDNLVIKKRGNRSPVRNCRTCANDRRRARREQVAA